MAHSADELSSSGYLDPLRDALDSAFTESDASLRASSTSSSALGSSSSAVAGGETPLPSQDAPASGDPAAPADDGWKAEYDERLAAWRAEAAVARQKAEEERARWAAIRGEEREAAEKRRKELEREEEERSRRESLRAGAGSGQEVGVSRSAAESSERVGQRREEGTRARLGEARLAAAVLAGPLEAEDVEASVADARDLTTSEHDGTGHMFSSMHSDFPSMISVPSTGSTPPTIPSMFQTTDTDSPVEVSNGEGEDKSSPDADADESSLNESAPRRRPMVGSSRPGDAPAASAASKPKQKPEHQGESEKDVVGAPAATPKSLAMSVFNAALPWRTRLAALAGTLAINLALPFVNGVMLGFGEIFARNYIAVWIGWTRRAGNAPTAVGIRY